MGDAKTVSTNSAGDGIAQSPSSRTLQYLQYIPAGEGVLILARPHTVEPILHSPGESRQETLPGNDGSVQPWDLSTMHFY
jgi:hypothetical protein